MKKRKTQRKPYDEKYQAKKKPSNEETSQILQKQSRQKKNREEVKQAANGKYPIVLGRNQSGIHLVLGSDELEQCNGSPQELLNRLQSL